MRFELIGHDNPLGRYPSPVAPVGLLEGELVVIFATAQGAHNVASRNIEVVPYSGEFVRHTEALADTLRDFDYEINRLFAFAQDDIEVYQITTEKQYFRRLIDDPEFSNTNPFLRYSISKEISNADILRTELYGCINYLIKQTDDTFINQWYLNERSVLLEMFEESAAMYFPETWRVLVRIEEQRKPAVFQPSPMLFGHSSTHVTGGAAAGMGAALVAVALFNSRAVAENAYRLLRERQYRLSDINLLMLRATFDILFPELGESSRAATEIPVNSLANVLLNRTYADLGDSGLVCAGPHAENIAGISGTIANIGEGLRRVGLGKNFARECDQRIRDGALLMSITSIPTSDLSFFEKHWLST